MVRKNNRSDNDDDNDNNVGSGNLAGALIIGAAAAIGAGAYWLYNRLSQPEKTEVLENVY